MIEEMNLKRKV